MALKNVRNLIQMTLKWLFCSRNWENCPATWGFAPRPPSILHLNCISLLNMPPQFQHFFKQGHVNLWFKSLSKILVAAVRFYFIQWIMDRSLAHPLTNFLRAPQLKSYPQSRSFRFTTRKVSLVINSNIMSYSQVKKANCQQIRHYWQY